MRTVLRALTTGKYTLLAVVAALTLVMASAAIAGSGVGGVFNLGKTNSVNALTKLTGAVTAPSLQIDNDSGNANATALDLQVQPGKPPMTVNSPKKVPNLNSDLLDGKDSTAYMASTIYSKFSTSSGTDLGSNNRLWAVYCNGGDRLLGGGYHGVDPTGTTVTADAPIDVHNGWLLEWTNVDGSADQISVYVLCADI